MRRAVEMASFFYNEVNKIYHIADVNGYGRKIVDSLIRKHIEKKEMRNLTTLTPMSSANTSASAIDDEGTGGRYTGGVFVDGLSIPLSRIFRRHSIVLSPNSTAYKMKTHFGSLKDKHETYQKSGIYAFICSDCDSVYIGQCCRACEIRFSEHYKPFHRHQYGKSTPADHMLVNGHNMAGFRLLKEVNDPCYLNEYENLFIYKTKRSNINVQCAQAISPLYKFTSLMTTSEIFERKF